MNHALCFHAANYSNREVDFTKSHSVTHGPAAKIIEITQRKKYNKGEALN